MTNAYIITANTATIYTDNGVNTVDDTHTNWTPILDALKEEDFDTVAELVDVAKAINTYGNGTVTVQNGVIMWNGTALHNALTTRILRMMNEGFNIDPMLNFLSNLMQNPSGRAVNELYRFLEANDLPVTPDGYFLAYKNVRDNYTDKHTGTFDNSIGSVCEMPRNQVMDDPNKTCSSGLHFCSIKYLREMWGFSGHTMIVKINPADVVSIPVDYENSKGRACRYEVIAEHFDKDQDTLSDQAVKSYSYEDDYEEDEDDDEYYDWSVSRYNWDY